MGLRFRHTLLLLMLGMTMLFFGCGRAGSSENPGPKRDVVLNVPGMY